MHLLTLRTKHRDVGVSVHLFSICLCCGLIHIGVTENTGTISPVQIFFLNIVSDSNVAKGPLVE